ncbi:uncharacterized protein LOC121342719 [Onychostruthus taczanowskii]|uniref:uncharacterized protein LOC121342719 n=1 Tax=Onychostruthus taczanowskii TaxID=356909 RepID=UPI001B806F6F|nr:uncharacterized protein LOC121342719 [Onychostruthus taczanowskii]
MKSCAQPSASGPGVPGTGRPRGEHRDHCRPPGTAEPFQSTGHRGTFPDHRAPQNHSSPPGTAGPFQSTEYRGTIPVNRAPWAGDSAKMSKRKPTPEEEPKKAIIVYLKSGEHTAPGDEPKKETNSDEKSWDDPNHGDKPKDGDCPGDGPDNGPDSGPDSGPDNSPDGGPKDVDNPERDSSGQCCHPCSLSPCTGKGWQGSG